MSAVGSQQELTAVVFCWWLVGIMLGCSFLLVSALLNSSSTFDLWLGLGLTTSEIALYYVFGAG